jgi:hypothetical protein
MNQNKCITRKGYIIELVDIHLISLKSYILPRYSFQKNNISISRDHLNSFIRIPATSTMRNHEAGKKADKTKTYRGSYTTAITRDLL